MTTTSHAGFLEAIIREPEADDLRLIYADVFDEQGKSHRAEFIRTQIDRESRPDCPDWCDHTPEHCRVERLLRRERELLERFQGRWTIDMLDTIPNPKRSELLQMVAHDATRIGKWPSDDAMFRFRRGFVEQVTLPAAAWLTNGPAIVRATPLRTVTLSGIEPYHNVAGCWIWVPFANGTDPMQAAVLPKELFRFAVAYRTRDAALSALSSACIAYAKAQPIDTPFRQ